MAVCSGITDGPKLAAAIPAVTVPQLVRERARRHPDERALIDGISGRTLNYG